MQALNSAPTPASYQALGENKDAAIRVSRPELTDVDILSVLCDLFAGRATTAFGEALDWWIETLQCDLSPKAAAGVALSVISKWHFDQRDGADGVQQLQAELLQRARRLLDEQSLRNKGKAA